MRSIDFNKIMIATDGSDCSMMAAGSGIELARLSGGTVYAVYVVSTNYASYVGVDFYWGEIYEAFKKDGENALKKIKQMGEKVKVNVKTILLEGYPADKLIKYAEEEGMDIVIMGTLGKTGLDRLFLGSVTENVVRNSKVPVLVFRAGGKS
jgi:nucleotide-binding universal stress UspA family protein